MGRVLETFAFIAHTTLTGAGSITLDPKCVSILISATTGVVNITFDNTTPTGTNGLQIINGAQPVLIPLGYHAHSSHILQASAGGAINLIQLG